MFIYLHKSFINSKTKRFYSKSIKDQVRVRFAPSPTGFLHLGGLRTALYNYLFAKAHNGTFILRIEDTDQTRLVEGAVKQLENDLIWSGIEIHEGPHVPNDKFGPYIQSQRLGIYKNHIEKLLENNSAYHCFCSEKRLELLRKEAIRAREVPKYDNRCRNLSKEEVSKKIDKAEKSCIRFKLSKGVEMFTDLIYGSISHDIAANEGDPVIFKTDGFPTYHFANVVDDHLMDISHVFRGVEWQISTTKHILMYRAFGWEPPQFGHLPLLINADGTKLSKRQGDIQISSYKENGIFPLALLNFITNSGGGFEKDAERHVKPKCYTIPELTRQFDITKINSHSGKLMPERLLEFNRLELKRKLDSEEETIELIENVRALVRKSFPNDKLETGSEHVKYILNWASSRINRLTDLVSNDLKFVWVTPNAYEIVETDLVVLETFSKSLNGNFTTDKEDLNVFLKEFCKENGIKFGGFMKVLRSVLSGLQQGPGVAEIMEILGKDNTLKRLELCIISSRK